MTRYFYFISMLAVMSSALAQDNTKGYYKDVFVDGGIYLTSRNDLPAVRYMGLTMESFLCGPATVEQKANYNYTDSLLQKELFAGSAIDENGVLLYPDGAPRFRMLYTNGGRSWKHARTVTEKGNQHINDYINHGGSYVGTCAGAFLASKAVVSTGKPTYVGLYYSIWPGYTCHTGLSYSSTTVSLEKKSPLLKYADFGKDMQVDSVRHNGGGFAVIDSMYPEGTEILPRYYTIGRKLRKDIHGKPVIWAYKTDENAGRIVMCGSHPEAVETGERLDLTAAMMRYAMEGNGTPRAKGKLENGVERKMYCFTHDNNPDFTAIGDKQYHHFVIDVPKGAGKITLSLKAKPGYSNYDLFLLAQPQKFAYLDEALYKNTALGSEKKLVITQPKAGKMYLSVFCNTTVDTVETKYGTSYTGRTDVLNGVPYSILAEIEMKENK